MIDLRIDHRDPALSLHHQLVQQIRGAIVAGRLGAGERLPSVRELAKQVDINPLTVGKAYAELERERLIETRWGKGSFVAAVGAERGRSQAQEHLATLADRFIAEALPLVDDADHLAELVRSRCRERSAAKPR
jgi:GntR family transcriptional regulator